jgi:UDP-glucose 6-dehydrogenase
MIIAVAGVDYVGLSNAVLMTQSHELTLLDAIKEKVKKISCRKHLIGDENLEDYLKNEKSNWNFFIKFNIGILETINYFKEKYKLNRKNK